MMKKEQNHYGVLGINEDADAAKVRQAYRIAARKHHPDSQSGDSTAFRRVQEAYDVLSDKELRSEYDRSRIHDIPDVEIRPEEIRRTPAIWSSFPASLFGSFFDNYLFGEPDSFQIEDKDLYMELVLSPVEAAAGGRLPIELPVESFGRATRSYTSTFVIELPAGLRSGHEMIFAIGSRRPGLAGRRLHVTIIVE